MYQHLDQSQIDENLARALMDQDKRVLFRRNYRVAKELEKEKQELQDMIKSKQNKELQLLNAQKEHEEELALEKERTEALRQQKLKQLAQDHHEVRKLKSQLQELLTKKQQHVQIEQHQIEKELSQLDKDKLKNEIERKTMEYERQVKLEEKAFKDNQKWYKDSLDCQMTEIEDKQELLFQEFLKEKHLIDNLLKTIQDENRLSHLQKQQEKRHIQNYIREFLQDQEMHKQRVAQAEFEENEKIRNYITQQEKNKLAISHKRTALDEIRERIYDQLAANIKKRDQDRYEQEELSFTAAQKNIEERELLSIKRELDKRTNDKIVLLESYKQHLIQKQKKDALALEEKLKIREELVAQLKEDERLEQMTNAAKKRRMSQYHHELSQLVDYKIKLNLEMQQNEQFLVSKIQSLEKEKVDILSIEKKKIIAEYALRLKIPEDQLLKIVENEGNHK